MVDAMVREVKPVMETDDGMALVDRMKTGREMIHRELRKVIVGQDEVVQQVLIALFAGGHSLITGVPGLAKTLLIKTLAEITRLKFGRIQFTPDLMPADVIGTEVVEEDPVTGRRQLKFVKGPIFANILLADEINRTPPKTQSALLEAMEEEQVTVGGVTYKMDAPFFVLATQNPIELEGTYPLPEAQLDRFMFKILIDYLPEEEEIIVVDNTTGAAATSAGPILSAADIIAFQKIVRQVPVAREVTRYAVRLTAASRPGNGSAPEAVQKWVSWGAGLRASQFLILGAKVRALLSGRFNVSYEDIRALAHPVMRHRIIVNFHAQAERIDTAHVIDRLLEAIAVPSSGL